MGWSARGPAFGRLALKSLIHHDRGVGPPGVESMAPPGVAESESSRHAMSAPIRPMEYSPTSFADGNRTGNAMARLAAGHAFPANEVARVGCHQYRASRTSSQGNSC